MFSEAEGKAKDGVSRSDSQMPSSVINVVDGVIIPGLKTWLRNQISTC